MHDSKKVYTKILLLFPYWYSTNFIFDFQQCTIYQEVT